MTGVKVLLEGELDKKADHSGLIGSSWQSKQVTIYHDGAVEYQKKGDKEIRKIVKVLDAVPNGSLLDVKAVILESEALKLRTFHFRAKNEQQAGRWGAALSQAKEARVDMQITFAEHEEVALIGPLEPLDAYKATNDRSNLRLGITLEGMWSFLAEAEFIQFTGKAEDLNHGSCREWKYLETYERREEMKWLDDYTGPIQTDEAEGLRNVTGYDVCDFVGRWLELKECQHLSVCEVILTTDMFPHLRRHVGRASVYWSHMHKEPLLRNGTLEAIERVRRGRSDELPPEDQQFFFVDYFTVRQAKPWDLKPAAVAALVSDIGSLVASIDRLVEYPSRSWCVLEIHAALTGRATLVCDAPISRSTVEELLETRPVASEKAMTCFPDDKVSIDSFFRVAGGFEVLDKIVSGAIVQGVAEEPVPDVPEPAAEPESPTASKKKAKAGAKDDKGKKAKSKDAKASKDESKEGKEGEKSTKPKTKKKTDKTAEKVDKGA